MNDRNYIIFCEEHYNPLGIVRTLGENAIEPVIVLLEGRYHLIEKSKYAKNIIHVNSVEEGYKYILQSYSHDKEKAVILTSDDTITGFLDAHYDDIKDTFIFYNAGASGRIGYYSNKKVILDAAKRNGLLTLPTVLVTKGTLNHGIEFPIITKASDPLIYGWKSDMRICESEENLEREYKTIRSDKVLIQHFIDKDNEYCLDGFSWDKGQKLYVSMASTYDYNIKGNYGPYMTITNFKNKEVEDGLQRLFAEIGFEGIFSVEFLIDKNGKYYFSEINFRNSTWSYASTRLGMPLPILWVQCMTDALDNIQPAHIPENFKAMVEFDDFRYRVRGNRISFLQWYKDYKNAGCRFYAGDQDIKPFIYSIFFRGVTLLRKKMRRKR